MIIGLCGRKRAGKDTAARYLSLALGMTHDSFAAPIRSAVAHILGITLEELERVKDQPNTEILGGKTPRYAMQTMGTEWGRDSIHSALWVNALFARNAGTDHLVISDVRFPSEAQAILRKGGIVVAIDRTMTGPFDPHASEKPMPDGMVTARVSNDGTVEELHRNLDAMLWDWKGRKAL